MHTLKPLDKLICVELAKKYRVIITVEENTLIGGLYGAISEVIASLNINCQLIPIGINDHFSSIVGDQAYLRSYYNIDNQTIYKTTLTHLKN
jgi:transketolase